MVRRETRRRPPSTHVAQAAAAGVVLPAAAPADTDTDADVLRVPFLGDAFRITDDVPGTMPFIVFAGAAMRYEEGSIQALAAMYDLLAEVLHPADFVRFQRHATAKRAMNNDLWAFVNEACAVMAARPQMPPGDSSAGRLPTSDTSKDSSPQTVTPPRPGLASVDSLRDRSTA